MQLPNNQGTAARSPGLFGNIDFFLGRIAGAATDHYIATQFPERVPDIDPNIDSALAEEAAANQETSALQRELARQRNQLLLIGGAALLVTVLVVKRFG
jgi:hypothetical protein